MIKVYPQSEVINAIRFPQDLEALLTSQRRAFIDFSSEEMVVPLPLQLRFEKAHGDCHVKGGYKKGDSSFFIKVVTGFYNNDRLGLPSGDGAILEISQETGMLKTILLEGGFLTTLRTAAAGLIAAQLTPWKVRNIGIIGTGTLAHQLLALAPFVFSQAELHSWGRTPHKREDLQRKFPALHIWENLDDFMGRCEVVFTATASRIPLIGPSHIMQSIHLVALGADEVGKRELDGKLFEKADIVLVDSMRQAQACGECYYALQEGTLVLEEIKELGNMLSSEDTLDAETFIITDLTGIGAQDIAIANFVRDRLQKNSR